MQKFGNYVACMLGECYWLGFKNYLFFIYPSRPFTDFLIYADIHLKA